jgi:peptidoglycan/LPS O-acetylase OafA/YrhL
MRAITELQLRAAYIAISLGVLIGIAGFVRTGALLISGGTGVIALAQWNKRRVERYLPLIIAVVLFSLAIALPKGL